MKATKEELKAILNEAIFNKMQLDKELIYLEEISQRLTREYNKINSLIGDTKNRLKKYAS